MTPRTRALCSLALLPLASCMPSTVTISLRPHDRDLKPATVIDEPGASARVALIDARGLISDTSPSPLFGDLPSTLDQILRRLDLARQDPSVKAVVIRINSPGGTVTASDICFREIRRFAQQTHKPVVASLGEVAASGGYYIALAADHIVAEPTSITGSIGVLFPGINVSTGLASIGVYSTTVTSGPNKHMGDPLQPINPEHQQLIQRLVDQFHLAFVHTLTHRRTIDPQRLPSLTDGRVLSGSDALDANLVDQIGGLRDAFDAAKQLASLDRARLVKYYEGPDSYRPDTPYSLAASQRPAATADTSPFSAGLIAPLLQLQPARPYYLWLP